NDDISWLLRLRRGEPAREPVRSKMGWPARQSIASLRSVFSPKFMQAVEDAHTYGYDRYYCTLASGELDLNDHARVVSKNFLPGLFVEIPQHLGERARETAL